MEKDNFEFTETDSFRFTISPPHLLKTLTGVCGVINNTNLVIYSHVCFSAKNENISFTASDGTTSIKRYVDTSDIKNVVNTGTEFTTLIPAKKLLNVLKTLGLVESTFAFCNFDNTLKIYSGNCKFTIITFSEEYPTINVVKDKPPLLIESHMLKNALKHVFWAAARDEVRYYLNGVLFELSSQKYLSLGASDGHRMALHQFHAPLAYNIIDKDKNIRFIIPILAVKELIKFCDFNYDFTVEILFDENFASFIIDGESLTTKLVDGTFPDYKQLFPTSGCKTVEKLNVKALMSALSRALILAHDKYKGIKITLGNNKFIISSTNQRQESSEIVIDIDYEDEDAEMGINCKYLIEAIKASKTEYLNFSICNDSICMLELQTTDYGLKHIIMSMVL